MKNKLILLTSIAFISQPIFAQDISKIYAQEKPIHGHPTHMLHVNNYARVIEPSADLKIIVPGFVNVLKQQPILEGKNHKSLSTIKKINDNVNSKDSYKLSPWMTPKQFDKAKFADCKGYAVTKYYAARAKGYKPEDLNLWSGDYDGHAHLVLTVRINENEVRVMDIMDRSLPLAQDYFFKHFTPSYRFNENGVDVE